MIIHNNDYDSTMIIIMIMTIIIIHDYDNNTQIESENMRNLLEKLMMFHGEVGAMEDLFKSVSRKFQGLVPELSADDIEEMMFVLKKEKENLVIVRSLIPTKIQLYHQILTQLDALEAGEQVSDDHA